MLFQYLFRIVLHVGCTALSLVSQVMNHIGGQPSVALSDILAPSSKYSRLVCT